MRINNQEDLVTIAIPAYKDKWLSEAIESALNQDYNNIELIIIDDHSPYNLNRIVKPYLKDKRVHYYYNETNLGRKSIVYNWNRCLELAKGDYFVLLCDDDILLPTFVSTLLCLANKYPKCNVFHGRRAVFDESTGKTNDEDAWPEYEEFDSFIDLENKPERKHTITEFLYRTPLIKSLKYQVFPVGYFSDNATILKLAKHGGIASSQEVICKFRNSKEHISDNKKYEFGKAKAVIQYYNWYQKNINKSLSDDKKNKILDCWLYGFYNHANSIGKIKILSITPSGVWGLKQNIYILLSSGVNKILSLIRELFS